MIIFKNTYQNILIYFLFHIPLIYQLKETNYEKAISNIQGRNYHTRQGNNYVKRRRGVRVSNEKIKWLVIMNLYLLTNTLYSPGQHDVYDSAVVAAKSSAKAKLIKIGDPTDTWAHPKDITVKLIGRALKSVEGEVIYIRSFNAG